MAPHMSKQLQPFSCHTAQQKLYNRHYLRQDTSLSDPAYYVGFTCHTIAGSRQPHSSRMTPSEDTRHVRSGLFLWICIFLSHQAAVFVPLRLQALQAFQGYKLLPLRLAVFTSKFFKVIVISRLG